MIPSGQSSEFVSRMERVLDVYKRPFNAAFPVVCMDESPKQLIEERTPSLPIKPGLDQRVDYEYIRHGVANVFMAMEPLTGKQFVEVTEYKTKKEWSLFVKRIAEEWYPMAEKITLVMDNFSTHDASAFYETFEAEKAKALWDRFEFIYTPKHGSWLNMAEIGLNILNRQCLNRHIPSMENLVEEVSAWQENRKGKNCKINWHFTYKDARIKLKKLYPSIHA